MLYSLVIEMCREFSRSLYRFSLVFFGGIYTHKYVMYTHTFFIHFFSLFNVLWLGWKRYFRAREKKSSRKTRWEMKAAKNLFYSAFFTLTLLGLGLQFTQKIITQSINVSHMSENNIVIVTPMTLSLFFLRLSFFEDNKRCHLHEGDNLSCLSIYWNTIQTLFSSSSSSRSSFFAPLRSTCKLLHSRGTKFSN